MNVGTRSRLSLPTSDVQLPPYARRLDVRATRAAFAAGTLGTVGDHPSGEDVQVGVELRHADRHNADVMHGDGIVRKWKPGLPTLVLLRETAAREAERQAFLRRVQYVDPRERRA